MVWIILILAARSVVAQSAPQKNPEALDVARARRESAVQISKSIAATVLNCEDRWVKIPALARLADALWKDDERYARRLFTHSLELCNPGDVPAEQQSALFNLRQQVLALLARRDAKLAERLVNANALLNGAENGSKSTEANFQIADRLVNTAPETAKEFAEHSLETGLSPAIGFFLQKLRLRNERAADQLFLQALNCLSTGRTTDVESLLLLGTYVFSFAGADNDRSSASVMVKFARFGPFLLVDIRGDRPDVQPRLITSYLETALKVISNPGADVAERAKLYVAATLLLKKTERFAPHLTAGMLGAMQSLATAVPPDVTQSASYKDETTTEPRTLDEAIREIETRKKPQLRDSSYVALVYDLWRDGDFEKARVAAGRISDLNLTSRLSALITFGEGLKLLQWDKKIEEAEKICDGLPLYIERPLFRLSLGRKYEESGKILRAAECFNAALNDARRLNDARAPYISLSVAAELARTDGADAMSVLVTSVEQFNALKSGSVEVRWVERVEAGMLWRDWPLRIEGVKYGFNDSIPELMRVDEAGVLQVLRTLKHEQHLAPALTEFACALLR